MTTAWELTTAQRQTNSPGVCPSVLMRDSAEASMGESWGEGCKHAKFRIKRVHFQSDWRWGREARWREYYPWLRTQIKSITWLESGQQLSSEGGNEDQRKISSSCCVCWREKAHLNLRMCPQISKSLFFPSQVFEYGLQLCGTCDPPASASTVSSASLYASVGSAGDQPSQGLCQWSHSSSTKIRVSKAAKQ